ncbi:uncharacterized protein LOC119379385 isoform X1 [Rhipicephalus sanguineus]|uniref:uncharacterized protein LOC119379385 isoform X1 n=1 Tax=Rhipicephalus sanguineus TaxID=34632 RepID=UPI0018950736|nr:uncharacterized protein LOC119379385 isoform X1 [Rhipicephalus sanguineus]
MLLVTPVFRKIVLLWRPQMKITPVFKKIGLLWRPQMKITPVFKKIGLLWRPQMKCHKMTSLNSSPQSCVHMLAHYGMPACRRILSKSSAVPSLSFHVLLFRQITL